MSKLSSITENKYTLRDIFARNHEVWLAIPIFCYLLTPVIHMIVYTLKFDTSTDNFETITQMMTTGEWVGNYYKSIIMVFTAFAVFFSVIAVLSHRSYLNSVKLFKFYFFFRILTQMLLLKSCLQDNKSKIFIYILRLN